MGCILGTTDINRFNEWKNPSTVTARLTDTILNRRKCCPMTKPLHLSWHVSETQIPVLDGTRCYSTHRGCYIAPTWNVQLVIESWNAMDLRSGAKGPPSSGRAPEWETWRGLEWDALPFCYEKNANLLSTHLSTTEFKELEALKWNLVDNHNTSRTVMSTLSVLRVVHQWFQFHNISTDQSLTAVYHMGTQLNNENN